ncbi:MAG: glucose 1-dehydrogenase [Bryobacterales bacterium]|nr:glucose 1-dehydrogenase [Bryobacterales bacterium]
MTQLNNKVAVITGGNSGIGFATAEAFLREGAFVAVFGRDAKTLAEAQAKLGERALVVAGDVTKAADLERLYREVQEKFGRGVDIVVANAGIAPARPMELVDDEHFDKQIAINVKGLFFTVQKALPYLRPGASVILVSSAVNVLGLPGMSVYSATKAAVRSFARSMSAELAPKGIRVNALSPGLVETPILGKMEVPPEQAAHIGESIVSAIPLKRIGRPQEIASAMVYLASDASSFMLGAELVADGGQTEL